ncbi:MAG: undecaprenyl/decaprenyl-phosphate alpha-N-acetylglucosaminyl 1-phosphate transferase [Chitinophagaceae bacterium]|nr:undecaprenyl/decaprenyl-phosphate alpha-N-acetylglucosaminyl 1-phosphate transferase [Chitinophagaceae bacterium]
MLTYSILIFIIALVLVCYSTQKVIYVANKKHLFDEPTEDRKIHLVRTPNLGGVAIFASLMFTFFLFLPYTSITNLNYIIASSVIMFIIGLTDDLVGVNPTKKMLAQLIVALIIAGPAGFRITSFYGFMGFNEIPFALSITGSVLFIMYLINAFNLIDGINCLAGSIGLLTCAMFAYFFWTLNETGFSFLAIAMCGCLAGFLWYNRTPAKIFMGDTGSLFLGFMVAIFSIRFMELSHSNAVKNTGVTFSSAPMLVYALLMIPVFDTFRVFTLRLLKKKSPFAADRNHIHHRLVDLNLSHMQATLVLVVTNVIALGIVFSLGKFGNEVIFVALSGFIVFSNWVLCHRFTQKSNKPPKTSPTYPNLLPTSQKKRTARELTPLS